MSAMETVAARPLHRVAPRPQELTAQPCRARRRDQPPAEVALAGRPPRGGGDRHGRHDGLGDVGDGGGGPAVVAEQDGPHGEGDQHRAGHHGRAPEEPLALDPAAGRRVRRAHDAAGGARHDHPTRPDGHRRHPIEAVPRRYRAGHRRLRSPAAHGRGHPSGQSVHLHGAPDSCRDPSPAALPPWRRAAGRQQWAVRRSTRRLLGADAEPAAAVVTPHCGGAAQTRNRHRTGPVAVRSSGARTVDQVGPYQPTTSTMASVVPPGEVVDADAARRRRASTSPGSARPARRPRS